MRSLVSVETGEKVIALTFDDGPDPEWTPALLDILKAHDARATFFVVGEAAARHPDIVRRTVSEGHALGNHTWSHPSVPTLAPGEQRREILRCRDAIAPDATRLFRPPFGHQTLASRWVTHRTGHSVVAWTDHVEDWNRQEAAVFSERLRACMKPGNIVLLHDTIRPRKGYAAATDFLIDRRPVFEALDEILGEMKQDYRFATVPELLESGRPRYELWRQVPPETEA